MTTKTITARAVKQIIGTYEVSYNQIVAAMKALAESDDDPLLVREFSKIVRHDADRLFTHMHNLHDGMASREKSQ